MYREKISTLTLVDKLLRNVVDWDVNVPFISTRAKADWYGINFKYYLSESLFEYKSFEYVSLGEIFNQFMFSYVKSTGKLSEVDLDFVRLASIQKVSSIYSRLHSAS